MTLGKYTMLVLGVVAAAAVVTVPLALRDLDAPARAAIAYGTALAVLNTLAAHALVVWSDGRPTQAFLRAVLGGMLGRMAAVLVAVVAGVLVLGLPINMDGSEGPRAQSTRAFARNLAPLDKRPIVFWDERLSTAAVTRTLLEADASRRRRDEVVDKLAASFILQGFLDRLHLASRADDPRRL